ncbi:endolytic transglycosylase MltG [Shewanella sp. YIC-542]|uniref:endolytic transglycosylase MltG n=1 Tax=Shewanella mytili TaxID=3377111 RepID=UPI00398E5532
MKKWLLFTAATLLALLTLLSALGLWGYQQLQQFSKTPLALDAPQEFQVAPGTSFHHLGRALQQQGLLQYDWHWKLLGKLQPSLTAIRSGVYEITPGDTPVSLLQKLVTGDEKRFSLTLVEGKTINEWRRYLQQLPHLTHTTQPFLQVLQQQGDLSAAPEGKFFPDTYQYRAGTALSTILEQSYRKMQQELQQVWQARAADLPLDSAYALLTLASIIEKETAKPEERQLIAAVFVNRLRKGMRLQTDPTVIYGMGDDFTGNLTRKDLLTTTPFNTYRIAGLPPTPIAAPGREALLAAAHPAQVKYLYFVSRNDGSHVFSNTLAEHNRAVNRYQRKK